MASLLLVTNQSKHSESKAAYVCPSCRMVFSLPKNMGGNGVVCPGCEYLLAIPSDADDMRVIGTSQSKYGTGIKENANREGEKRHRDYNVREHHEWTHSHHDHGEKSLKVMMSIAIISLLLIGGLAFLMLAGSNDSATELNNSNLTDLGNLLTQPNQEPVVQTGYIYDPNDANKVEQLEGFLTGFFAVFTVDEMLPYVLPTEGIKEKMTRFYQGEIIKQSPFKELNFAQSMSDVPGFLSFESQTQDYKLHAGVLRYSADEILLDWESYVAYSEMSWAELAEKKPTKPVRLRVFAKLAFYYNEEFANEEDWQSVALTSPNEEKPIYGYVKRGSATYLRMFNFGVSNNRRVILEVYFPEGAKNGDQVFIERVAEQGWLITEEK